MDNLYFIILSNVLLISLVNIYFNRLIYHGQTYYSVQFLFLSFIMIHSIYICVVRSFLPESDFTNIGAPFGLFYAPFFFIGISVLIDDRSNVVQNIWKHFLPGLIFTVIFIILLLFRDQYLMLKKVYLITMYGLTCIQMVLYCISAFMKFNSAVTDKKSIAVMSQSIILMLSTALIFLSFVLSDAKEKSNTFNSLVVYVLMLGAVMILFRYNLLILVRKFNYYKKSYTGRMFFDYNKGEDIFLENEKVDLAQEVITLDEDENIKYQKSRISEKEIKSSIDKLKRIMATKIYLDSDLTLDLLAKQMKIPKYHLTQVFNLGMQSNFNKYINTQRVLYAVSLLDDPHNQDKIEEIMMQSGFNSRSSFYRAFHQHYDLSPADYRKAKRDIK